jgi:4,5-dihydroxyphthalate decarboxylase
VTGVGRIPVTMAISGYHHTDDLASGAVPVDGVDLTVLTLPIEEIFFRFTKFREWQVSEMAFGKYIAMRSRGDDSLVGLPIFPSRVFRHSSIYVRADGPRTATDLAGTRIGIPEWAQTASIYTRGLLRDEYNIGLADVAWVQAGLSEPGREEKVDIDLPAGVSLTRVADRSLDQMLLSGDIDAVMSAHAPPSFENGSPQIRRLFQDYAPVERAYGARTGIFPIMHLMVMRADVYGDHPWLAANLVSAFEQAKERSLHRLVEATASRIALPWVAPTLEAVSRELFGGQHWPYGVEANRTTLTYLCRNAFEQGVAARELAPEELFAAETRNRYRI